MIYKGIIFKAEPFSYNLEFDDRITPRWIYLGKDHLSGYIQIPRGLQDELLDRAKRADIDCEIEDERQQGRNINVDFIGELRSEQDKALKELVKYGSVTPDNPIAILSEAIARIEMIKVNSNRIVTVENLTSYNRINDNKSTFIYLSGYHNTAKQRFLKKIAENNSGVSWFHFGDIDPDGYYILKNLVEKTGIAFVPLYMDVQQLINCKQYCKPLEKNDMVKANSLLKFHFYDEVMEFMLANNCKLEQEIISWLYERD